MIIFIDESGLFLPSYGFSVVCALAMPHKSVGRVRREIMRISRDWPRRDGELKGGMLDPHHLESLVDTLHRRSGVLHCTAIDVSAESGAGIAHHKAMQCEGITKHLTPDHYPRLVESVWRLRRTLEAMPDQLYIQSVATTELVASTANDAVTYFCQRQPRELGAFEWIVDAKDPKRITTQESWWRDTLGPIVQSKSLRDPFAKVDDPSFNYFYFDKAFSSETDIWLPDKPRVRVSGFDIKKLMSDQVAFVDSRSDVLVQAADILASFMRRVLNGELADDVVLTALGRLQILRSREGALQSVQVISLSDNVSLQRPAISRALRRMSGAGRSMIL